MAINPFSAMIIPAKYHVMTIQAAEPEGCVRKRITIVGESPQVIALRPCRSRQIESGFRRMI